MKTYKALIILAIALFLMLVSIAGITIVIYLAAGKSKVELGLSEQLASVDNEIATGYFTTAAETLKKASKYCVLQKDYLRLLKRAYTIDVYRKNFLLLKEYALPAWKKFPKDETITFLAAYAALKNENLLQAGDILKNGIKSEKLNRLRLQIELLKGEENEARILKLGESISEGLRLLHSDDPQLFLQIGMQLNDKRLLLNAALLFMQAGKVEEAHRIVQNELFAEEFDEAAVFIAYDAEDRNTALFRINRLLAKYPEQADYYALAGDLYFQEKEYSDAKFSYLKALNYQKTNSPALYLNLNWIYQYEAEEDAAEIILENGLDYFPGNLDILYEKAKLFKKQARYQEAKTLISTFPGTLNADLQLLLLYLNQRTMLPEQFSVKLWEIFNENADNSLICKTLVSLLLKLDNIKDANTAMENYTGASGIISNSWLLHYRGLIAGINRELGQAEKLLSESLKLEEDDFVRYNLGVIQLKQGNYTDSISNFRQVLKLDKESLEKAPAFYSRVVMHIGEAMADQGDVRGAMKQYDYALEIFPGNYPVMLLRKKLETINKK